MQRKDSRASTLKLTAFWNDARARALFLQALFLLAVLLFVIYRTPWPVRSLEEVEATTKPIGRLLMTDYLLPFEVISVLLFAVLVGAALIARREVKR